jgi:hypothetical protein
MPIPARAGGPTRTDRDPTPKPKFPNQVNTDAARRSQTEFDRSLHLDNAAWARLGKCGASHGYHAAVDPRSGHCARNASEALRDRVKKAAAVRT